MDSVVSIIYLWLQEKEIMVKTKENFNHLTNYQSLEEHVSRLGFFFQLYCQNPCSVFHLFYPVPIDLSPHGLQNGCFSCWAPCSHIIAFRTRRNVLFVTGNKNLLRRSLQQITALVSNVPELASASHSQVYHGEREEDCPHLVYTRYALVSQARGGFCFPWAHCQMQEWGSCDPKKNQEGDSNQLHLPPG